MIPTRNRASLDPLLIFDRGVISRAGRFYLLSSPFPSPFPPSFPLSLSLCLASPRPFLPAQPLTVSPTRTNRPSFVRRLFPRSVLLPITEERRGLRSRSILSPTENSRSYASRLVVISRRDRFYDSFNASMPTSEPASFDRSSFTCIISRILLESSPLRFNTLEYFQTLLLLLPVETIAGKAASINFIERCIHSGVFDVQNAERACQFHS